MIDDIVVSLKFVVPLRLLIHAHVLLKIYWGLYDINFFIHHVITKLFHHEWYFFQAMIFLERKFSTWRYWLVSGTHTIIVKIFRIHGLIKGEKSSARWLLELGIIFNYIILHKHVKRVISLLILVPFEFEPVNDIILKRIALNYLASDKFVERFGDIRIIIAVSHY